MRVWIPALAGLIALAGAALPALAQDAAPNADLCRRERAELAGLNRDGGGSGREELARLTAYYHSIDCERGRFLFFDTRPPQCEAVAQRIRYLGAQPANDGYVRVRRQQLLAGIAEHCAGMQPDMPQQSARGGSQVICVRSCDGGYFPLNNLPEGRRGADEMCQALCPGTQASAYSMPAGDDALKHAASMDGRRAYTALPNAFKYRTAFVQNCSCKGDGQSWAQALARAEAMLPAHKGDIIVTAAQADRLSRPKVRLILLGRADKAASTVAGVAASAAQRGAQDAETPNEERRNASVPTAGTQSAGIGPRVIEKAPVLGQEVGPVRTVSNGEDEKQVRVIAPTLIPVPRSGTL